MTIELDHMGLTVSDFERAKAFYAAALKPLGGGVIMEFPAGTVGPFAMAGLGVAGKPFFWITSGAKTAPHLHVAFRAETREQVDEFYAAAMEAGGTDNGQPGLRLHYHANYYGAFVLDPDGHNIEAVCHASLAEMNAATHAAAAPARKKKVARKKVAAKKAAAKKAAAKKAAARKAPAKKKLARKPARKAAAKKPAKKVAKKVAKKKAVVRKPVGRGRKTKR
jgi:catechol 2,3-dioxygenase-like lactoylglutathione lyase family enzyme